ncbi:B12-binding domain-containing radical SAM protein [candidate division WOR-3 bacterium]|nr:B12-binding domain-containing radical SAM protein [candidate division WOR-3 bacterium]
MKALLINPPFQRLKGLEDIYFPLGLGCIAAVLEKKAVQTNIYNVEVPSPEEHLKTPSISLLLSTHQSYIKALRDRTHYVWGEITDVLHEWQPDIVGISVMTAKYTSAKIVSELVKEYRKDCVVIWGGPHPTVAPEDILRECQVDFVVRGEGEDTVCELIDLLAGYTTVEIIDGISYKRREKVIHNRNRELIKELDELSFPARHLLWRQEAYPPAAFGHLEAARGCPYRCTFCNTQAIWGRRVRKRALKNVIKEIKEIQNLYKTILFHFVDESFTIDRNYVLGLCRKIRDEKLDISWVCTTRVDRIDDDLLREMKQANCNAISVGIESGSQRMLKLIKKDISIDKIKTATNLLVKNNIDWHAYFMIGFPQETENDLQATIKMMREITPSTFTLSIYTPYPGTELFQLTKQYGLLSDNIDWSRFSHQSPENVFVKSISKEKFKLYSHYITKFVNKYNNSPISMLRRALLRKELYFKHPKLFIKLAMKPLRRLFHS